MNLWTSRNKCHVFTHRRWQSRAASPLSAPHLASLHQNPASVGGEGTAIGGWLVALDGVHRGEDFRLLLGRQSLGSAWDNTLAITAPEISLHHAEVLINPDGSATIRSLAERAHVEVNGQSISESELMDGDDVRLGSARFLFRHAQQCDAGYRPQFRERPVQRSPQSSTSLSHFVTGWLVAKYGPFRGSDFRVLNQSTRIGSASGLEISLLDQHLETHQCTISFKDGSHTLLPIAAQGRLLCNGKLVTGPLPLRDSDEIECGMGSYYFKCL